MLYGIQREEQERLAREGYRSGVLVRTAPIGIHGSCAAWRNGPQICGSWREICLLHKSVEVRDAGVCVHWLVVAAAVFLLASEKPEPEWKQLINGKDLSGWKHVGPGEMTGWPTGLIETHGGMGLLYWTGGKIGPLQAARGFSRCVISTTIPVSYIRIPLEPREAWMPVPLWLRSAD